MVAGGGRVISATGGAVSEEVVRLRGEGDDHVGGLFFGVVEIYGGFFFFFFL